MVACGHLINSLYHLHVDVDESINLSKQIVNAIGSKRSRDEINLKYIWHHRLGHIREERINRLMKDGLLDLFADESISVCVFCLQRKMTKLSFIGHKKKIIKVLTLVHIDVYDPFNVLTRGDYPYFITFIDNFLWYRYVFLMRYKSEVFERFKKFKSEVEKQTKKSLKVV